ncbi:MAG: hypothetical protein H6908_04455 [Hyphomicrobiales bacterium]|nr:hypothetical protein [Hyphomicrobiales bacterium]
MGAFRHDISGCFSTGLTPDEYKTLLGSYGHHAGAVAQQLLDGHLPMLSICQQSDDLPTIQNAATAMLKRARRLHILGAGGSSLTGQALAGLLPAQTNPLYFIETIDPWAFRNWLSNLDFTQDHILIISKSGGTLETLAQAYLLLEHLVQLPGAPAPSECITMVSDPKDNPLRRLARAHGIPVLEHPATIGGRFSLFTIVALLPAAFAGLDIAAFRAGAEHTLQEFLANPDSSAALEAATLHHLLQQRGKTQMVSLPYADRLQGYNRWARQVWAESLGKGGNGTTFIDAIGPADQHSQLQLYLDGPADKWFTLFYTGAENNTLPLPDSLDKTLDYMRGSSLDRIFFAEAEATYQTLQQHVIPVRRFLLDTINEASLGALSSQLMLETILMGKIYGINTFDQPAVEQGKRLAREALKEQRA